MLTSSAWRSLSWLYLYFTVLKLEVRVSVMVIV